MMIELKNITKSFFNVEVLHGVSLEVQRGEIHALLGENGAGKSTLMKILSGLYQPSSGEIVKDGKTISLDSVKDAQQHGINTIFQELSLIPNMNTWENIFLGKEKFSKFRLDKKYMRAKARSSLLSLEVDIDIDLPICELSIANQQFIEIAKALLEESDVLILDEPTSTLTPNEVRHLFKVMEKLQKRGVTMIFISHHLEELFQICQRVSILRDGHFIKMHELSAVDKELLISQMVGREYISNYPPKRHFETETFFELNSQEGQKSSFQVRRGEILGIFGLVGAGRTELMMQILGLDGNFNGALQFNGSKITIKKPAEALQLGIGLLPEDRKFAGLMLNTNILGNIVINNMKTIIYKGKLESVKAQSYLKKLHIKCTDIYQDVKFLSGGNQQKVVIARWLCANCQLLIFDEPTRGIDIGAKHEIYQLMDEFVKGGKSIIMISSEINEIIGMSDRIAVMKNGEIKATLDSGAMPDEILACAI